MLKLIFFKVFLPCAIVLLSKCLVKGNILAQKMPPAVIVDLLIVCDKDFSDRFQQNRQKLMNYWATYMWDVNMRFRTLSKMDVSFRVTSLLTIKTRDQQPFIEELNNVTGSQPLHKFSEWIFANENKFNEFDIAILVTGAKKLSGESIGYVQSACQKNNALKRHISTFLIHSSSLFGDSQCSLFEFFLGILLGAPKTHNGNASNPCKNYNNLMSCTCTASKYFFSKCTDDAIAQHLKGNETTCLRSSTHVSINALETFSAPKRPTFKDQCIMITNNVNATSTEAENQCLVAKCYHMVNGRLTFLRNIYPIDNSQCGHDKFCFRSRCLPQGYLLQNVGSGECLHASNRFSSDDFPTKTKCNKYPTPLDQVMILNKGPSGIYLATPYSTLNGNENADKCLSANLYDGILEYRRCSHQHSFIFGWDIYKVGNQYDYLLVHRLSKLCAAVDADNNTIITKSCDNDDLWIRWKFYNGPELPENWYKINITEPTQATVTTKLTTRTTIMLTSPTIGKTTTIVTDQIETETTTEEGKFESSYTTDVANFSVSDPVNIKHAEEFVEHTEWSNVLIVVSICIGFMIGIVFLLALQKYRKWRNKKLLNRCESECAVGYTNKMNSINLLD